MFGFEEKKYLSKCTYIFQRCKKVCRRMFHRAKRCTEAFLSLKWKTKETVHGIMHRTQNSGIKLQRNKVLTSGSIRMQRT